MELESAMPETIYSHLIQEEATVSVQVKQGKICLVVTPVAPTGSEWQITFDEEELLQVYHEMGKAIGSLTVKL